MTFTVDVFHRGRFAIVQPAKSGHRAGIDAMLVAASVPDGFAGVVADFGAGAGAAGMAVAARCAAAQVALVENDKMMADFARLSARHEQNAAFSGRLRIVEADVSLTGKARAAAGLADRAFDFVIMNPPFNSARDRATPDRLKAAAHVMEDGMFEDWLRSAAAVLKPSGVMALIARPQSLDEIVPACAGRFGALQILPVLPRPDEAAIRIIVRALKGSRGALALLPPLVLHGHEGNGYLPEAEATINGLRALFRDK